MFLNPFDRFEKRTLDQGETFVVVHNGRSTFSAGSIVKSSTLLRVDNIILSRHSVRWPEKINPALLY